MIDLEYSRYITELLMDNELNEKLRSRRFDALRKMRGITAQYEEEKFLPELVETVFCKKADFIMRAKTKAELEEIIKPSSPRYSGGIFYPGNPYHVEEEELILWSKTSLKAPLISQGYKRYQELFEKYVKDEARNEAA
ncbi:hypothetical protein AALB51_12265 [Lachnospiraceae bacterium 62-26]